MVCGKNAKIKSGYRTIGARAKYVLGLAASATVAALAPMVWAGANKVDVQRVTRGSARFSEMGNVLTVRAADRTVINYGRFDINPGGTVRFIQPSKDSRVLNRINSVSPSRIDGTLQANGSVYFVNRAGITFGANAIVNVGKIYAAAGNITDSDFLRGFNNFHLTGNVTNEGTIVAADTAALMGRQVSNFGRIEANIVMMASGDEVMIGPRTGQVFVKVNPEEDRSLVAESGLGLGAGDLYAMAIRSEGEVKGQSVTLDSGKSGVTTVGGTIDASNHSAGGKGGEVRVLGGTVELKGASIDASGSAGGGRVMVGGDFHGAGGVATAGNTVVDAGSMIRADALDIGDGGSVVVWSDELTLYSGRISARGGSAGGNGGFVEVSGKEELSFTGHADVSAEFGSPGMILLDPRDITIDTGGTDTVTGALLSHSTGGATDFTIDPATLEGLTGSVTLQAQQDIFVKANLNMDKLALGSNVVLQAGRDITIDIAGGGNFYVGKSGVGSNLTLEASAAVPTADPNGQLWVKAGNTIKTWGGNLDMKGAVIKLDGVVDGAGAMAMRGGSIAVDGKITANSLDAKSSAGNITIGVLGKVFANTQSYEAHNATNDAYVSATVGTFGSTTGGAGPVSFSVRQDKAIVLKPGDATNNVPALAQFVAAPGSYSLQSDHGAVSAELGTADFTTTNFSLKSVGFGVALVGDTAVKSLAVDGETIQLGGKISAVGGVGGAGITLVAKGPGTLGTGESITVDYDISSDALLSIKSIGKITVGNDVDLKAATLAIEAGSGGTGDLKFGTNVTLWATNQTLVAGDGVGGGGAAAIVDARTNAPTIRALDGAAVPEYFEITQDGPINTPTLPDSGQFAVVAALPGSYKLESSEDSTTFISDVNRPSMTLSLAAAKTLTVQSETDGFNFTAGITTLKGGAGIVLGGTYTFGSLSATGNVILNKNLDLVSSVSTFSGTIDSEATKSYYVHVTGDVGFGGNIGTSVNSTVSSVTVTGKTALSGAVVKTALHQSFGGEITLNQAGSTFSGTSGTFAGIVAGSVGPAFNDLTLNFTDTTRLAAFGGGGAGTRIRNLRAGDPAGVTNGGGTIEIAGSITTTGDQLYQRKVKLDASVTLQGSSIGFDQQIVTLTGAQGLTLKGNTATNANVTFGGDVTTQYLDVGGATTLIGATVTTVTAQTYGGVLTLSPDALVGTNNKKLTGSTFEFKGDVKAAEDFKQSLTVTSTSVAVLPANIVFSGSIGDSSKGLTYLNIEDFKSVQLGTDTTATITSSTSSNLLNMYGPQTFSGDVLLGSNVILSGSTVRFKQTANSVNAANHDLTIDGSSTFDVSGALLRDVRKLVTTGNGTAQLSGALTTAAGGSATFKTPVVLVKEVVGVATNDVTVKSTTISFEKTVDANSADVDEQSLTVISTTPSAGAPITFAGVVGQTAGAALKHLDVQGNAQISGGTVNTKGTVSTGNQTYSGDVTLGKSTGEWSVQDVSGLTVYFKQKVDSAVDNKAFLTVRADAEFLGDVGSVHALNGLSVSGATGLSGNVKTGGSAGVGPDEAGAEASAPAFLPGDVVPGELALGYQTYNALTLRNTLTLTAGAITFNKNVNAVASGQQGLTISADTVVFNEDVGNTFALGHLDIRADKISLNVNADSVRTSATAGLTGQQRYGEAASHQSVMSLGGGTLNKILEGKSIRFESTVDDVDGTSAQSLTLKGDPILLTGAAVTFTGSVGATNALKFLAVNGTTTVGALANEQKTIQTAWSPTPVDPTIGRQTYTGDVTLAQNVTLWGTSVTFGSLVVGNDRNLTLNFIDDVALDLNKLGNLNKFETDRPDTLPDASKFGPRGRTRISGTLVTDDVQTFNDDVVLLGAAQLAGSSVVFGRLADDGNSLIGGTINSDGANNRTLAVVISDPVGKAIFNGNVGTLVGGALAQLTVAGNSEINATTVVTSAVGGTGRQTYSGQVSLGTVNPKPSGTIINVNKTLSGSSMYFGGVVFSETDGAFSLTINGNPTFAGMVGLIPSGDPVKPLADRRLKFLTVNGSTTVAGGGAIVTTGNQTYDDQLVSNVGLKLLVDTILQGGDTNPDKSIVHGGALIKTIVDGGSPNHDLTLNFTDDVTIDENFTNIRNLTSDGKKKDDTDFFPQARTIINSSISTSGTQIYTDDVKFALAPGKDPVTLTSTGTHFVRTVDGPGQVTLNFRTAGGAVTTDATVTFGGAVGWSDAMPLGPGLIPLTSLTVNGKTEIENTVDADRNLFGGLIETSGFQRYADTVTLNTDAQIRVSIVTFAGTIDGSASHRSLEIAGNAEFDAAVGLPANELEHLTVSGWTRMGAGSVDTTDEQLYGGAVTLTSNNVLTGSTISFDSTLDGNYNLTLNGIITFGDSALADTVGGAMPLASLTANGTVLLNGDAVHTNVGSGFQTYNGAVTLGNPGLADKWFQGYDITFNQPVLDETAGDHNLRVSAADLAKFNDMVGTDTQQLWRLTSDGNGPANVNAVTEINGGRVQTLDTQDYKTAVTLGRNTFGGVIRGGDAKLTGERVTFFKTVNSANDQRYALDVLSDATTFAAGDAAFNGEVGTAKAAKQWAALKHLTVAGTTEMNATKVTTDSTSGSEGYQSYAGAVTLMSDTTLNATSPTAGALTGVTFVGVVNGNTSGGEFLHINANAQLGGNVGGLVDSGIELEDLYVQGTTNLLGKAITTKVGGGTGNQTYVGDVTLGGGGGAVEKVLTGGGIWVQNKVDSASSGVQSLTLTGANAPSADVTFSGRVGSSAPLGYLDVEGTTRLEGDLIDTNSGGQTYAGEVTLSIPALNLTGQSVDKHVHGVSILFEDKVNAETIGVESLTLTGPGGATSVTFDGAVGNQFPLNYLNVVGTTRLNGPGVTTDGAEGTQTYVGAVLLGVNGTPQPNKLLTGKGIWFKSTVDAVDYGKESLAVDGPAGSKVTFDGSVGSVGALGYLDVGMDAFLGGATFATTNEMGVSGDQTYGGTVVLTSPSTPTSSSNKLVKAHGVVFERTVDANGQGGESLTVRGPGVTPAAVAGMATFIGNVGNAKPSQGSALKYLAIDGNTQLYAHIVNTIATGGGSGSQTYGGTVTLQGALGSSSEDTNPNKRLTGNWIGFGSSVDASADGAQSLTLNGQGGEANVTFDGNVGVIHPLKYLDVQGKTRLDGKIVQTVGAEGFQTYAGKVTLGLPVGGVADPVNKILKANWVWFNSTVDALTSGGESLTLAGWGSTNAKVTFNGNVGTDLPLKFLDVEGTTTLLNGQIVQTNGGPGSQTYAGAVTLGGSGALSDKQFKGNWVYFKSTVDAMNAGVQSATVVGWGTKNGVATFDGNVGGIAPLKFADVEGTMRLNGTSITTAGLQTYTGAVTLGLPVPNARGESADKVLTGSGVLFGLTVDAVDGGLESLKIKGNGSQNAQATFTGSVGAGTNLRFLVVDGDTKLIGKEVHTTAYQSFVGNMTLSGSGSAADKVLTGTKVSFGQSASEAGGSRHAGKVNADAAQSLQLLVDEVWFNGSVGADAGGALRYINVDGSGAHGFKAQLNAEQFTTNAGQTYGGVVTLGPDLSAVAHKNGSTALFKNTLDASSAGAQKLSVNGDVQFEKAVGKIQAPNALTVNGNTTINGGSIDTVNDQMYTFTGDGIFLGADTVLTSGAGNLTINRGNILRGNEHDLTLNIALLDDVGTNFTGIHDLEADAPGTTRIWGNVDTSGTQVYGDPVAVMESSFLTGTSVAFENTVDADQANRPALKITMKGSEGSATFAENVGGERALESLQIIGTANLNGDQINTANSQTFDGNVTIGGGVTLSLSEAGASPNKALFTQTVNGGSLRISGDGGNAVFDNTVGGATSQLKSLWVEKTTALDIATSHDSGSASVRTIDGQTYGGAVTLKQGTRLVAGASAGDIVFGSTVNGERNERPFLQISAHESTFKDSVGIGFGILGSLEVTGPVTLALNAGSAPMFVRAAGKHVYQGLITLETSPTLAGEAIDLTGGLSGGGNNLTLAASNAVTQGSALTGLGDLGIAGGKGASYTLTNVGNEVVSLHGATGKDLSFSESDGYVIARDGATASGLNAASIHLNVASGKVYQVAKKKAQRGPINASSLTLSGGKGTQYDLTLGNVVETLNVSTKGSVNYVNASQLTLSPGATADEGITLRTVTGDLVVNDITAKDGSISLYVSTAFVDDKNDHKHLPSNYYDEKGAADPANAALVYQVFEPAALIRLNGNLDAGKDIVLGDRFDKQSPSRATIIADRPLTLNAGGEFFMHRGQKMTVMGDLDITAGTDAMLSDITALGGITVEAPQVYLVARPASFNIGWDSETGQFTVDALDSGTDLVAGRNIVLNSAVRPQFTTDGVDAKPLDANTDVRLIQTLSEPALPPFAFVSFNEDSKIKGFAPRQYPTAINDATLSLKDEALKDLPESQLLDLRADGHAVADLGTTFALALPAEMPRPTQDSAVDSAQRQLLGQMGIRAKEAEDLGLGFVDWLSGRAVYEDQPRPRGKDVDRGDYLLTPNRLSRPMVNGLVIKFRKIYSPTKPNALRRDQGVANHIASRLNELTKEYRDPKNKTKAADLWNMAQLRQYIDGHDGEMKETLARIQDLMQDIEQLGLSPKELEYSKEELLMCIQPAALKPDTADRRAPEVMEQLVSPARPVASR